MVTKPDTYVQLPFLKETFVSYTRSQPKPQFSFVEKVGVSEELLLGFLKL